MAADNKSNWLLPPSEVPKEQRTMYESVKAEVDERATRFMERLKRFISHEELKQLGVDIPI